MSDLFSNTRFVAFRTELEKQGRHLKILWSARSGCIDVHGKKLKYDDVVCFALYGGKVRSGTIIVKDYGEDGGFGLYTEPDSDHTYAGDVEDIICGREKQMEALHKIANCGYVCDVGDEHMRTTAREAVAELEFVTT
jgi:hypothetical protein